MTSHLPLHWHAGSYSCGHVNIDIHIIFQPSLFCACSPTKYMRHVGQISDSLTSFFINSPKLHALIYETGFAHKKRWSGCEKQYQPRWLKNWPNRVINRKQTGSWRQGLESNAREVQRITTRQGEKKIIAGSENKFVGPLMFFGRIEKYWHWRPTMQDWQP